MGCCNEPAAALASAALDPSQHVNYARGMVLGVDDFTQEFAYLAGRARWLAREAVGYGTTTGLAVAAEDGGADGPRLRVTAGAALVPAGRLVCVPVDQCAVINRWLAKPENAATVTRLLNPVSPPVSPPASPPAVPDVTSGVVSLYLTLCHHECLTRPVPIPGEPCRAADELMAPSRVADDFRLELRARPPAQVEEDALRDYVLWLRKHVQFGDFSPPPPGDDAAWLEALRPAAAPWLDAASASPPPSPPPSYDTLGDYLVDLESPVRVAGWQAGDFLRLALRFWVTELRPMWMAYRCHRAAHPDTDCVLLARVEVEVVWVGGSPAGAWQVAGSPAAVVVDERTRPFLGSLRMLQEWTLAAMGGGGGGGGGEDTAAPPPENGGSGGSGEDVAPEVMAFRSTAARDGLPEGLLVGGRDERGRETLRTAEPGTDYYAPGFPVRVEDGGTGSSAPPTDGQLLAGSGGAYAPAGLAAGLAAVRAREGMEIGLDPAAAPRFAGLTTTGAVHLAVAAAVEGMRLDERHHVVVCGRGISRLLLPPAAGAAGRVYVVKNAEPRAVTVEVAEGGRIDGDASTTLRRGDAKTLVSDGRGWFVVATVL